MDSLKQTENDDVTISNETVEGVNNYKYLGVIFDGKLNWCDHTQKVQKKLN